MALFDLAVYSEFAYETFTEVLRQQINLFNSASRGAIRLKTVPHVGDFSDAVSWGKVNGLVRRRNPYSNASVSEVHLRQITDTMVKVAAGTPPVELDPVQFTWIQKNPEEGGVVLGRQLAVDTMADMLNTALMAGVAALKGVPAVVYDGTGDTPDTMTPSMQVKGAALFGDASNAIAAWVMHSTPLHNFYLNNVQNAERLFTYGTVNVIADPFGRVFICTDSPALIEAGTPNIFNTLGLVPEAMIVDQNSDFIDNWDYTNGKENIHRTYQAEWSYELGVKGFSWDKTNGGKAPADAAIAVTANWDKYVTSNKDLAGVLIRSN